MAGHLPIIAVNSRDRNSPLKSFKINLSSTNGIWIELIRQCALFLLWSVYYMDVICKYQQYCKSTVNNGMLSLTPNSGTAYKSRNKKLETHSFLSFLYYFSILHFIWIVEFIYSLVCFSALLNFRGVRSYIKKLLRVLKNL